MSAVRKTGADQIELGNRLKEARERSGMAVSQIAESLEVSTQSIYQWEAGETAPRRHRFAQLAQLYGVSATWLQMGIDDEEKKKEPAPPSVLSLAVGPDNALVPLVPLDEIEGFWKSKAKAGSRKRFATHFHCSKESVATVMQDQSMIPLLERGDLLIVDPEERPLPGDLVLCRIAGDNPSIRRYRVLPGGKIELVAYHEDWPSLVVEASEAQIIGVVTEQTRPRRP